MAHKLRDLLQQLKDDPFRTATPFDLNLKASAGQLSKARNDIDRTKILSEWLAKYQPCLFGRIAARLGALSYCFLSEADLTESDEHVHEKIQGSRLEWRRRAFNGDASGFVILAMSERIANAVPDDVVKAL